MAVGTSNLDGYALLTPLALDVLDMVRNKTPVMMPGMQKSASDRLESILYGP